MPRMQDALGKGDPTPAGPHDALQARLATCETLASNKMLVLSV